jgi:hypothetical protein
MTIARSGRAVSALHYTPAAEIAIGVVSIARVHDGGVRGEQSLTRGSTTADVTRNDLNRWYRDGELGDPFFAPRPVNSTASARLAA